MVFLVSLTWSITTHPFNEDCRPASYNGLSVLRVCFDNCFKDAFWKRFYCFEGLVLIKQGMLSRCMLAEELQLYCGSAYHNKIWIIVLRNPFSSSPPSSNSAPPLSWAPFPTWEKYQMISAIWFPSNYKRMSRNPSSPNPNLYPVNTTNSSARITLSP